MFRRGGTLHGCHAAGRARCIAPLRIAGNGRSARRHRQGRRGRLRCRRPQVVAATTARQIRGFRGNGLANQGVLAGGGEMARANALAIQEPGAWDLILCRNVAIYLSAGASTRLWQNIAKSLRPGGVLVPGKAERPLARADWPSGLRVSTGARFSRSCLHAVERSATFDDQVNAQGECG